MIKLKQHPYLVVVSGTLMMLMMGVAYVWGVYITSLIGHFGWTRAQASMPFSIYLLFYTVGMIVGGRLQDRYGPQKVCGVGAFLFGLGYLLSGFAPNLWIMCFVYGIISGVGTGLAYVTPMATVVKWFPKKKGLMGGIVVFGFGAGAFIFSPLVRFLINQFSWQAAFVSLGMIFLVVGILLSRFIQLPPSDFDQQEENASEKNVALVNWSPTHVLRSRIFWLAWSAWFLVLTVGLGLMGHIVSYASGAGIDAMSAAYILSVIAIFNGAGRIIFGGVSDYIGRVNSLIGACFVMASVIGGLIFFGDQLFFLYSLGAVFGLCFGTCLVLYPMFASEIFGTKHLGVNYGMLFSSYGVGGFVGPILFGRLYDMSGDYQLILLISAGLCIVAGVLAIMVWKTVGMNKMDSRIIR